MSDIITIRQHIDESLQEAGSFLIRHTCPIYKCGENKRPAFEGSGFFLSVDSGIYLITAAHVFQAIKNVQSPIYVGVGDIIARLPRVGAYRTKNPNGTDHADICAIPIQKDCDVYNSIENIAIPIEGTLYRRSFEHAHLKLVQGYPASKNKPAKSVDHLHRMVSVTSLTTGHELARNPEFSKFGKEQDKHFALEWKKVRGANQPPHPKGMSGGPFWVIPNSLHPKVAYLGGVFIEMHEKSEVAFVTKISEAICLIREMRA